MERTYRTFSQLQGELNGKSLKKTGKTEVFIQLGQYAEGDAELNVPAGFEVWYPLEGPQGKYGFLSMEELKDFREYEISDFSRALRETAVPEQPGVMSLTEIVRNSASTHNFMQQIQETNAGRS